MFKIYQINLIISIKVVRKLLCQLSHKQRISRIQIYSMRIRCNLLH